MLLRKILEEDAIRASMTVASASAAAARHHERKDEHGEDDGDDSGAVGVDAVRAFEDFLSVTKRLLFIGTADDDEDDDEDGEEAAPRANKRRRVCAPADIDAYRTSDETIGAALTAEKMVLKDSMHYPAKIRRAMRMALWISFSRWLSSFPRHPREDATPRCPFQDRDVHLLTRHALEIPFVDGESTKANATRQAIKSRFTDITKEMARRYWQEQQAKAELPQKERDAAAAGMARVWRTLLMLREYALGTGRRIVRLDAADETGDDAREIRAILKRIAPRFLEKAAEEAKSGSSGADMLQFHYTTAYIGMQLPLHSNEPDPDAPESRGVVTASMATVESTAQKILPEAERAADLLLLRSAAFVGRRISSRIEAHARDPLSHADPRTEDYYLSFPPASEEGAAHHHHRRSPFVLPHARRTERYDAMAKEALLLAHWKNLYARTIVYVDDGSDRWRISRPERAWSDPFCDRYCVLWAHWGSEHAEDLIAPPTQTDPRSDLDKLPRILQVGSRTWLVMSYLQEGPTAVLYICPGFLAALSAWIYIVKTVHGGLDENEKTVPLPHSL